MAAVPESMWITLIEAADRLGLSVDAVRRRVRNGQLAARKVEGPRGFIWLVNPEAATVVAEHSATMVDHGATTVADDRQDGGALEAGLLERLDRMQIDLLTKAEAAAMWQARAEMLAGELADARGQLQQRDETIRALTPPQPEPVPQEPAVAPEPADEPPAASQPGILRRAWRWLAGADGG